MKKTILTAGVAIATIGPRRPAIGEREQQD